MLKAWEPPDARLFASLVKPNEALCEARQAKFSFTEAERTLMPGTLLAYKNIRLDDSISLRSNLSKNGQLPLGLSITFLLLSH